METQVLLEAIEQLPDEGKQELYDFLEVLIHKYIPEYAEIAYPDDRVEELAPEVEEYYKRELDKRLERVEEDPHPGYSMQDIVSELESETVSKLQRENNTAVLSARESRLLKKINRTAPNLIQKQYDVLMEKKREENLSEIEYENLIELTSFMESLQTER